MTIETEVAALTTATTTLITNVQTNQTSLNAAVTTFTATTTRVNALNLVENTADLNKVVSTATIAALGLKQDTLVNGTNLSTVNGQSLLSGAPLVIERSATSISHKTYAQIEELRALEPVLDDSVIVHSVGLYSWEDSKTEPDDSITCFHTTSGQWVLELPAWDMVFASQLFERETIADWIEDEPTRFAAYLLANT